MTLILKQSTSIDIRIGPFVDATDGVAPETGITLAGADQAEVLKFNGAATVAMAGTFTAITGADGWYDYTVATGDVDTVGEVVFVVQDASVCLPVFVRGQVVEEAVYDNLFLAAATAPATEAKQDTAQTDLDTLTGTDGVTLATAQANYAPATPAQVNTEVLDVLNTDTFAEPAQGAPAATTTLVDKIGYIYKALRNRKTATATTISIYNDDATTVDHKRTISDNGTTYDEEEIVTGP